MPCHHGPQGGSTSEEAERSQGKAQATSFLGFTWERQGRVNSSALANLNNYGRLWGREDTPICLVPGHGLISG